MRHFLTATAVAAFLAAAATADVESGPAVGGKAGPLKAAVTTGDDAGKDAELLAGKDAVVVFVRADRWDRPAARYLKALDGGVGKGRVLAVWLTDDADKSKAYTPKALASLGLERTTFAVAPGGFAGPDGWGVNADAHVTAVVVAGGKVAARFGYQSVNETDAPAVLKAAGAGK